MQQFKIKYTEYTAEGALTNLVHADYFQSADFAELRYNELKQIYWTDDEGKATTIKRNKVELEICGYKTVEDPTAFFKQFYIE